MRIALAAWVMSTAVSAAPCVTIDQAEAAAGFKGAVLPTTWPPTGGTVRFYDFNFVPLPTGIVSYGIQSPSVEVTVPLDGSAVKRRSLGARKTLGRSTGARIDLTAAHAALLKAVCESRMPDVAEAAQLREAYRAWLGGESDVRAWLSAQLPHFVAWVFAAPVGANLTARISGKDVVMTRDGKDVRFAANDLETAQLTVFPLKSDGTEPVLWVNTGTEGLLVRYADVPQIIHRQLYTTSQRGIGSVSRAVWLLDVDGDGFNDVVEYATSRTDVGAQFEGATVARFDPLLGVFTPGDRALAKKAPKFHADADQRVTRAVGDQRKRIDLISVRQPGPAAPDSITGGWSPPLVGRDVMQVVLTKKTNEYRLLHLRFDSEPKIVSNVLLGTFEFPTRRCQSSEETLRREGDVTIVTWPAGSEILERRVVGTNAGELIHKPGC